MTDGALWRPWKPIALLLAVLCLAAEGDVVGEAEATHWLTRNLYILIIMAFVATLVGWSIYAFWKISRARTEEEEAAMLFEARMGTLASECRAATRREAAAPEAKAVPAAGQEPPAVAAPAAPPSAPAAASPPPSQAVDGIVSQLQTAGLFGAIEGTVFLSDGKSEGKIVRLTNGKTAVVLPRPESPEFMARQVKRFDLCIVPLSGEQVAVVSPLGTYIADHFRL